MFLNDLILGGGLTSVTNSLLTQWVQPVFILIVAAFALYFIKNRQFRELGAFVVIATIVGIMVFLGKDFFGQEGKLTSSVSKVAKGVNIAQVHMLDE